MYQDMILLPVTAQWKIPTSPNRAVYDKGAMTTVNGIKSSYILMASLYVHSKSTLHMLPAVCALQGMNTDDNANSCTAATAAESSMLRRRPVELAKSEESAHQSAHHPLF